MRQSSRPRVWSRRAVLRQGVGGLAVFGGLVLAACGQTPAAPAGEQKPGASGPASAAKPAEPAKPAGAAPTTQGAAKPADTAGLTTDQINLLFMGHVAGGANEQKAYDDILGEWMKNHPNIKIEYQVVPDQDRITKATAMVAAGQAPDMWRHNGGVIRLWAAQGH